MLRMKMTVHLSEMTHHLPHLQVSRGKPWILFHSVIPGWSNKRQRINRSRDGFCCAGLSPSILIDGYHMALSGQPTNYDMIRTELRGARELDLKDPRGVPERCRRRTLEILAWTDMENGYIIHCCIISNCQSPVTIKELNTLEVNLFIMYKF